MPTITERAEAALKSDAYITPEQSLEYLQNPWNFQSFSKYIKRLAAAKGIEFNVRNLPDYLTAKEKRNIQGFFTRADQADQEGRPPKTSGIKRELALKLCFALQLDETEARDFLRKGCAAYSFNVRSAYESTCLYCILTKQSYETVLDILGKYEASTDQPADANRDIGTKVLQATLEGTNWESNEDFLRSFLIPNKTNFTEYSRTTIQSYGILRSSLCRKIIEGRLEYYQNLKDTPEFESDTLMQNLHRHIKKLAKKDPDFAESAEKFSDWTQAMDTLEDIQDIFLTKYEDPAQARACYAGLLNDSVSSEQLMSNTLLYIEQSRPKKRIVVKNGKKRLVEDPQRTNSDSALIQTIDCFPNPKYFDEFNNKKNQEKLSKSEKIRKMMVLLFFMDRFYDLFSGTGFLTPDDGQEYNKFYQDLNNLLIDCNLSVLYPADPFDWLILKSARTMLMLDANEDADPISYLNDVIELSFPAEKSTGLNGSWILEESDLD